LTSVEQERAKLKLSGPQDIIRSMQTWLGLSPFAVVKKQVA
jgi:hypothetical protein